MLAAPRRRFFRFAGAVVLASLAALAGGCLDDRRAGTEVGNPELVIAAAFRILPSDSDWAVEGFEAKCMGVDYATMGGDSGSIWIREEGYRVDFMGGAEGPPPMTFTGEDWGKAGVWVKFAAGPDSLPPDVAWQDLSDPHWIRLRRKGDDARFAVALPDSLQLRLDYDRARLEGFRSGDTLMLDVVFDLDRWLTHNGDWGLAERQGPDGIRYSVLAPASNAEAYGRLEASLADCFLADKVTLRPH